MKARIIIIPPPHGGSGGLMNMSVFRGWLYHGPPLGGIIIILKSLLIVFHALY
jgi:hypothetical protein